MVHASHRIENGSLPPHACARSVSAALVIVALLGFRPLLSHSPALIIRVPADSVSIEAAIRGAEAGDTVLVAPGTYVENINFLGKGILVTSESGPESTIIDGSAPAHPDSGSVVYFVSGEDSNAILDGFTITSGSGTYMEVWSDWWGRCGGGILCAGGAAPVVFHNTIAGNVAMVGGGIACTYSPARILGNVIEFDVAETAGGGIFCRYADAWIEGNVVANCTASSYGGGLELDTDATTVLGNTIIWNMCPTGAGIDAFDHNGVIQENRIAHNQGGVSGGINCEGGESRIARNVIEHNFCGGFGGGIFCLRDDSVIEGNSIRFNSGGFGGGICGQEGAPEIVCNTIAGNVAQGVGGGMDIGSLAVQPTFVANNLIIENSADGGGGIVAGFARVENNTISQNSAYFGGGILCWVAPEPEFLVITNNVVVDNFGGYGIYNDSTYSFCVPDLSYNDVWGNGANYFGCQPGHGDISVDPEFAEPDYGHFSLLPSSPCIDAGDASLTDPDGTRSNMGAFGGPDAKLVHLTFASNINWISPGQTISYEAILSNNFADPLTTFGLTELLMPTGFPSPLNPLIGPMRVSLGPYQTVRKTISHYVPPAAPEGEYQYTGKVGFPPDVLEDLDAFSFTVVQP